MIFQECVPNGRKILSPSHCVGAYACKILCSLHEEYHEPRFWGEFDLDQGTRSHAHSTRVCGQRPRGCRADEGYELAPFHCPDASRACDKKDSTPQLRQAARAAATFA